MAAAAAAGKILLTGSTGQVGGELLPLLSRLGEVVAPARGAMDMADAASVRDVIRTVRPRWIVSPAAYTAVDKAESEPELAYAVNRDAVCVIGEEARAIGAGVVHFSTDYVFDGAGERPYVEDDAANPAGVYGASKLAGEQALAASGAGHLIFRTSWVYGARGKNFLLTILRLAREREVVRVVADQHGAPTWSRELARMTVHVMAQCEEQCAGQLDGQGGSLADVLAQVGGVYHAACLGETTWHGFAAEAVRLAQAREPAVRFAAIEAITTAEYPTAARRPLNSRLNMDRLAARFGWRMADWRESLGKVMAEI